MKSRSIRYKIIAAIIAVLSVSIFISIIITTENQKKNLLDTATQTLAVNTDMLNQVIRNIMLSGEAEIATRTLNSIKGLESFKEVEIYRTTGEAAFSDYKTVDFVNDFQNEVMFNYTDRRESSMTDNEAFKMVLNSNTPLVRELKKNREMEYFFPILNYAECRVCHGEEDFIRGVSHFKISIDNIYDKVNFARIVLSAFFIFIGIVIFFLLFNLLKKMVIDRIISIGETVSIVATGNLDVQIEMKSTDELGALSERINNMIQSLKEKKQLEIEHALTETSLKENRKYLSNIREGLILVNRDLIINENYSLFMREMFGERDISGKKLTDFLFPARDSDSEKRDDLEMFISLLFNNVTADIDMISDINPLLDCWINLGDRKILIDAFVQRIIGDGDKVENIMIIFKDKTSIFYAEKELEEERKRAQSELDYIATLLNTGPDTFLKFIGEAETVMTDLKEGISRLNEREFVEKSFREIHSLKGTAGYFNFRTIETLAHDLETRLKEKSPENIEPVLEELFREFEAVKGLINRFRDFADQSKSELEQFFTSLKSMAQRITEDQEKQIQFDFSSDLETLPGLDNLKNALIHLIRNSIDHGIEAPLERVGAGKSETAMISLKIQKNSANRIDISISDDGGGINFTGLEKKARELGILKESDPADQKKLLNLIFHSGFSTKSEVSEISGRGVGLDAVREDIKKLGGTIGVTSFKGKGTRFTIHLPVEGE